jgi:Carboxypeptidase regulatory-like domain
MRAASLALVVIAALGGLTVGLIAAPGAARPALRSMVALARGKGEDTAALSGRVRLQGRPVPYARIELHNGGTHVAHTGPDGSFVFEGVPAGKAQVTVQTGEMPASGPDGDVEVAPEARFVPERYGAVATSGIQLELKPGSQYRSILLRD